MRIALVHMRHAAVGGTELVLNQLAHGLAERGHEVTVVCRSHVAAPHPAVRFQVLRSPVVGAAWRMWAFAADVERHVAEARYDLVFALGKTWTHDVIRSSGGSHATFMEHMRRSGGGSWRDSPLLRGLKDRMALSIEQRAYAPGAYRRVIANSRLVRDDISRRYGVPHELVEVVYNGVDLERFHPRRREGSAAWRQALGIGEREFVFLFLGSGFARKGLERTLRAFGAVALRAPQCRLVVVGHDSDRARHERLAAELGPRARVTFTGPRGDPEACFAAADVHVLPTWYDSFGFSVLEALAAGTPVITTAAAGAAELLEHGVQGDVLPVDCSHESLAESMTAWCDPARVEAARAPARGRAEGFGVAAAMERTMQVLEDVARTGVAVPGVRV